MVLIRTISPYFEGIGKVMRIWEIAEGQALACPASWSKMMPAEWDNSVAGMGGVEQDYINALGITEVQDMR